jgi:N-methylhydantoinase B/oxoprolinase/acetone carboxylase alpha subunit
LTNTRNTPVEALERSFPLRVRRYRVRAGSGGAGEFSGGDGIERDVEVLDDCTVSLITERRVSAPWGLAGGEPGSPGENLLLPGGDETRAERLPDKCTVRLQAGDVLRMLTPGGGSWGAPASRWTLKVQLVYLASDAPMGPRTAMATAHGFRSRYRWALV